MKQIHDFLKSFAESPLWYLCIGAIVGAALMLSAMVAFADDEPPLPPVFDEGVMLAQNIFTPAVPSVPSVPSVYAPIPQPQAISPDDYFQQPSAQQVEEQRAGTAAAERNHYFISDCHKYSRSCLNELQTLD